MSDYEKVRDFTIQAGQSCTSVCTALNEQEVRFLLRMCLSELQELALTISNSTDESVNILYECLKTIDRSPYEKLTTEDEIIAAQADAVVDAWYYSCNAFAKKSVDVSQIFNLVHQSNMDKRDPKTNTFIKRDDGKIIKPENWSPPDVVAEISRQRKVLVDKETLQGYTELLDTSIPENINNNAVKGICITSLKRFIKNGIPLPEIEIDVDEFNNCNITLMWHDKIKYFIHNNGTTSVLNLKDLKIVCNCSHTPWVAENAIENLLERLK